MDRIFQMLNKLKVRPPAWLGDESIHELCTFVNGYELAIMDLTGERIRFDALFQNYIENKFPSDHAMHWDRLLVQIFSQERALDEFYRQLESFQQAYELSDLTVFLVASRCRERTSFQLLYCAAEGEKRCLGCYDSKEAAQYALAALRTEKEYCSNPSCFLII